MVYTSNPTKIKVKKVPMGSHIDFKVLGKKFRYPWKRPSFEHILTESLGSYLVVWEHENKLP